MLRTFYRLTSPYFLFWFSAWPQSILSPTRVVRCHELRTQNSKSSSVQSARRVVVSYTTFCSHSSQALRRRRAIAIILHKTNGSTRVISIFFFVCLFFPFFYFVLSSSVLSTSLACYLPAQIVLGLFARCYCCVRVWILVLRRVELVAHAQTPFSPNGTGMFPTLAPKICTMTSSSLCCQLCRSAAIPPQSAS